MPAVRDSVGGDDDEGSGWDAGDDDLELPGDLVRQL